MVGIMAFDPLSLLIDSNKIATVKNNLDCGAERHAHAFPAGQTTQV